MQLKKETHVGYQAELDQCGHEEKDLGLDMSGGVIEGKQRASTCCYQAEKGALSCIIDYGRQSARCLANIVSFPHHC